VSPAAQQSSINQSFSSSQTAGKPVHSCPLKCNLKLLKITEPKGGTSEKKISRAVEIHPQGKLTRTASPTLIAPGGKFQITANSKLTNEPRELQFSVVTEATCPGAKHPLLAWKDSTEDKKIVGKKGEGKFYRQDLSCDRGGGFFSFLNAAFGMNSTRTYLVEADSCGRPQSPKGIPAPELLAVVEVFPGDHFEAELELPAAKKTELVDKKSENATTDRDRQGEAIKKEGDEAAAGYEASSKTARAGWGSKADYVKYHEDQKKEELGYKDREPEGLKVKLTQKDGPRTAEAKVDEIIELYELARNVEKRIKAIQEWIEDIQVGPTATLKAEIEILVVSLKAEWGYEEFKDDRVYLAASASLSIEVIKGSIEAIFGFKSAGLADVLAFIKGEGAIKVTASLKHESPDEDFKPDIAVGGEFKLSGGVRGQAMWVVKAEGKLQAGFSVELQHIHIFQKDAMLKGELEIKLAAMQLVLTVSCWLMGSKQRSYELTKEHTWPIPIGK
jgi:hypothetical protein